MAMFRRRRWPLAVAAAAVVGVVALAVLLLARGGDDEPPAPPVATGTVEPGIVETADPVPDVTPPAVAQDAVLVASDAELKSYVDHQVTMSDVRVLEVVGSDAVLVGESERDRVLVITVSTENQFRVEPGARLSFVGTLRPLTRAFARALGLEGAALDDVARQGTYVEITEFRAS